MVKPALHLSMTASALAVMVLVFVPPVAAQRVSLADRVALLEQNTVQAREAAGKANLEQLNQLTRLSAELRELRGQIEALQQQNEQLTSTLRSQSRDLDERLQALERSTRALPAESGDTDEVADRQGIVPSPVHDAGADAAPVETAAELALAAGESDAVELAPDPGDERARYETAFDALKSGRYPEAARLFQAFLQTFPDGVYAANARYWLGESYYVVDRYAEAQGEFEALIERWPEHDKAPGALLKIGLSQYGQKQFDSAEASLNEVERRYPGTDAARIAADRLRAIQLSRLN